MVGEARSPVASGTMRGIRRYSINIPINTLISTRCSTRIRVSISKLTINFTTTRKGCANAMTET